MSFVIQISYLLVSEKTFLSTTEKNHSPPTCNNTFCLAAEIKDHISPQRTTEIFSHLEHYCHRIMRGEIHIIENKIRKNLRKEASL